MPSVARAVKRVRCRGLCYTAVFCLSVFCLPSSVLCFPAWWISRGAVVTNPAADHAAVNAGQVKWFATNAYDELQAHLPNGAGTGVVALLSGFPLTNNHMAINVGQLKFVGTPFYDRLIAVGYTTNYPWTETTTDDRDHAMANIGQLKYLFSFDLTVDLGGNGLPDWWETRYGLSPGEDNSASRVGWWQFEEAAGPVLYDSSDQGNNGTATNMDPWLRVAGYPVGHALDFDGTNDYAVVPHDASLMPTSAITVAGWIYMDSWDSNGWQTILSKNTDVSISYTLIGAADDGGLMQFYIGGVDTYATAAMSTGCWAHVAGVYDGTNISVYVNGVPGDPVLYTNGIPSDPGDVKIGSFAVDPPDLRFDGRMADVRIYNSALSSQAISNLMTAVLDSDGDGLNNLAEYQHWTSPTNSDTDYDGVNDSAEISAGTDPCNSNSFPVSISGTVSYSSIQTGPVWVVAATTSNSWATNRYATLANPGSYSITNLYGLTNYWVKAWRDSDGDGTPDYWEASGSYPPNPLCLSSSAASINITLSNPSNDADEDGLPDWWEMTFFSDLDEGSAGDPDADGRSNAGEYQLGGHPANTDPPTVSLGGLVDGRQITHWYDGFMQAVGQWELNYTLTPIDGWGLLTVKQGTNFDQSSTVLYSEWVQGTANGQIALSNCWDNPLTVVARWAPVSYTGHWPPAGTDISPSPEPTGTAAANPPDTEMELSIDPNPNVVTAGCNEADFWVLPSPTDHVGKVWTVEPYLFPLAADNDSFSVVPEDQRGGRYVVTVRSGSDTNVTAEAFLDVIYMDIGETITNTWHPQDSGSLQLTENSHYAPMAMGSVQWTVNTNGLSHDSSGSGVFTFNPGASVATSYVVTARSSLRTNCYDTATVNVYRLEITPPETNVSVQTSDAVLCLSANSWWGTNSWQSQGEVEWISSPDGLSFTHTDTSFTIVPSNSTPNDYTVTAYMTSLTNCRSSAAVNIVKVDIVEPGCGKRGGQVRCAGLHLTPDSATDVDWTIIPTLAGGTQFSSAQQGGTSLGTSTTGTNVWLFPGSVCTSYTVTATASNCADAWDAVEFRVRHLYDDPRGDTILEFADPINLSGESSRIKATDIAIPCPGLDLTLERVYNNKLADNDSGLGAGWTHSLNWFFLEMTNTAYRGVTGDYWMALSAGDDSLHWFERNPNGSYQSPQEDSLLLTTNSAGWQVEAPGKIFYTFNTDLVLTAVSNLVGNAISLTYTNWGATQRLARVEHNNGLALDFTYTNGSLMRVDAPSSAFYVSYSYNTNGTLVSSVRVLSSFSQTNAYFYGPDGLSITQRVNSAGDAFAYTFNYATNEADEVTSKPGWAGISASNYMSAALSYGAAGSGTGAVTFQRGSTNITWNCFFDLTNRKASSIAMPGQTTSFGRNAGLDLTNATTTAGGHSVQVNRQFDSNHNPTQSAVGYNAAATNAWNYTWHADYQTPTSVTDPEGHQTGFDYENGLMTRSKLFHTTNSSYDTTFGYTASGLLSAVTNANGHWVQYAYDGYGRLSQVMPQVGPTVTYSNNVLGFTEKIVMPGDSGNRTTTLEPDELGRVKTITYPDGLYETSAFDPIGNMTNHMDRAGRTTAYTYLPTRKLSSVTRQLATSNLTTSVSYDTQFNVLTIKDGLGRSVETYSLDDLDRMTNVVNLEGQNLAMTYAVGGFVSKVTRFDGTVVSNSYNSDGLLSNIAYPGSSISFSYLKNNLLRTASNVVCTISNSWSFANRLMSQTSVGPELVERVVSYSYFPAGQVSDVTSLAGTTTYDLDAADRVSCFTTKNQEQGTTNVFQLSYNPNNALLSGLTCTNTSVSVSYGYNVMDCVTNIAWATASSNLAGFSYLYNNALMITNRQTTVNGVQTTEIFGYDDLDRLISETSVGSVTSVVQYSYDLAGNRTQVIENGVTNTYTLGDGNRLATWGTSGAAWYNAAGCATTLVHSATSRLDLTWDSQYQVTQIKTNGALAESYGYDPFGRRVSISDGATTNFMVYDGGNVIAEVDGNGSLKKSYLYGPPGVLAMTVYGAATNTYYFLSDCAGTIHAACDSTGAVVESYRYNAWGKVLGVYDGSGSPLTQSAIGNRYLFHGKEYSWKTGLYLNGARRYDPVVGRFISKDPSGIENGLNEYEFCSNNPVNFVDPTGEGPVEWRAWWEEAAANGFQHGGVVGNLKGSVCSQIATMLDVFGLEDVESDAAAQYKLDGKDPGEVAEEDAGGLDAIDILSGALFVGDVILGGPTGEGIGPAAALQAAKQGGKKVLKDAAREANRKLTKQLKEQIKREIKKGGNQSEEVRKLQQQLRNALQRPSGKGAHQGKGNDFTGYH